MGIQASGEACVQYICMTEDELARLRGRVEQSTRWWCFLNWRCCRMGPEPSPRQPARRSLIFSSDSPGGCGDFSRKPAQTRAPLTFVAFKAAIDSFFHNFCDYRQQLTTLTTDHFRFIRVPVSQPW
jgi:hypothetical protein